MSPIDLSQRFLVLFLVYKPTYHVNDMHVKYLVPDFNLVTTYGAKDVSQL